MNRNYHSIFHQHLSISNNRNLIAAIYTPQYKWFTNEIAKVNRTETPWLIVLMHSPMYSSYVHHYMEGETMRVMYEEWLVRYKVDVVFAGHVHAYERSVRIWHSLIKNRDHS